MHTELLETDVAYAAPVDVEDFFKASSFDASSDPSVERVEQKLLEASDTVDRHTRRAWRERQVPEREFRVKFSHKQKKRAKRRRGANRYVPKADTRGTVSLPHTDIRPWDPAKGDKLEVLKPRSAIDITDQQGREDGVWVMDNRKGVLRIDHSQFRRGPVRGTGTLERPRIRISYRYGRDTAYDTYESSSGKVARVLAQPAALKRATSMLVASDLIDSDSYSDLVPGGEAAVDQENAGTRYEERAHQVLKEYRYTPTLI